MGSSPKTRSCLQQEAMRTPLQALDSRDSPFTTAGLCPGVVPGMPVAWWTDIGAPQMDLEVWVSTFYRDTIVIIHCHVEITQVHHWFECLLPSGGYEGYRPPFSNAQSSGYGQTQFSTSRDYTNNTYQRVRVPFIINLNRFVPVPCPYSF